MNLTAVAAAAVVVDSEVIVLLSEISTELDTAALSVNGRLEYAGPLPLLKILLVILIVSVV